MTHKEWIRGVNLGGWLVVERYIVPYLFAVTDCHLEGHLCWYPGQLSADTSSPDYIVCDLYQCRPQLSVPVTGGSPDYPLDEYSLAEAFLLAHQGRGDGDSTYRNKQGLHIAERWFNSHFDNFIQESDIRELADFGITHIRVPIPHWILGNVLENEPWIVGNRWKAFLRVLEWARTYNLQVWPDIHTAPGSQNGFDNSGHALPDIGCQGWSNNATHVARSRQVIRDISHAIVQAGYGDVVTGFGLLNEPFKDCNRQVYEQFMDNAKNDVYSILGPDTSIYVSDMFLAKTFNNGHWWLDERPNTYLDSHYYHVFAAKPRNLSPRQHIAFTCQKHWKDAVSCCYQDARKPWYQPWKATNTIPSRGVERIVGEWSAAYDTLPAAKLSQIMQGIAVNGTAIEFHRQFNEDELDFLKHFVEAQMVAFESKDTKTSAGWFYWTVKMEGGAFAEWDFLRGVREGWIPDLPGINQPAEDVYGTCYDIIFKTKDDTDDVIHAFPDPLTRPSSVWQGPDIDDDVVVSHGQSLMRGDYHLQRYELHPHYDWLLWLLGCVAVLITAAVSSRLGRRYGKQAQYTELSQGHHSIVV